VADWGGGGTGGGVEDREDSLIESRREAVSPSLTVLTEGEGGIAVSEETVGGAGAAERFRARYERYEGPAVDCLEVEDVVTSSLSSIKGPELVQRSIRS